MGVQKRASVTNFIIFRLGFRSVLGLGLELVLELGLVLGLVLGLYVIAPPSD